MRKISDVYKNRENIQSQTNHVFQLSKMKIMEKRKISKTRNHMIVNNSFRHYMTIVAISHLFCCENNTNHEIKVIFVRSAI